MKNHRCGSVVEFLEPRLVLSSAAALPLDAATTPSFSKSIVTGTSSTNPTSLQFGPDGRLYVAQQNGLIKVYTIAQQTAGQFKVTATQTIASIQSIPNHNDNGSLNTAVNTRLVTGLLVTGTAANPVIYVSSSDPRIGGGDNNIQTNLDTNSGIISRLTWNGSSWVKLDLVRGLPRSEENHATNGMVLDPDTDILYVAQGGTTNMGAPSHNFGYLPEYALSSAILSIDLKTIGNTTYNLPTLDDQNRTGNPDANDPFGGDLGNNQAILVPGGPVQVYSPGYRNPYDIVLTQSGNLYTIDNGSNAGWGAPPIGSGATVTNKVSEPGVTYPDQLQLITQGFYAGHPNPTRANKANTFDPTHAQSPVSLADPKEGNYLIPGAQDGALTTFSDSTNGIAEYTASNFGGAMKGNLLAASLNNTLYRMQLNAAGTAVVSKQALFNNVDAAPLDVTTQGDSGAFPGTIWIADIGSGDILAFAPSDNAGGSATDSATLDDDGDGFSNHDELLNGTNPESSADVPTDNDHDFVSNLLDGDDDNDGLPDTSDPYAVDRKNGRATNLPVKLEFGKDGLGAGGLLNMGFTGLMANGKTDYATEYDASMLTAGGAAGVFTLDQVGAGTALGAANSQQNAFQIGFNATTTSPQFVVHTKVLAPFAGLTPQPGQSMGFYIGTGDQDNYLKMVVSGDQGGSLEIVKEVGGIATNGATVALSLSGVAEINLYLTVNPANGAVQPSYTITRNGVVGASTNLGSPISVPTTWFSNPTIAPAAGLISTRGNAPTFPATWGALEITPLTSRQLSSSASSVDFGAAKVGVTISKTIVLKNNGASSQGPIIIQSVALSGANAGSFGTSFNNAKPVTLQAGQSLTLTINCRPIAAGNLSALLVINQNGANGALTIPLTAWSSAKASVAITLNGGNLGIDASTWTPGSFVVTNNSPDGQKINQIVIDLRNSLLPDLIITPTTAGGDDVPKDLTADSDPAAVGLGTHVYSVPLDGGYQVLTINFANFGPGKTFKFSFDIDPSSIKGGHSPGPNGSGGISGLELTGSSWTASFSDGSTQIAQIYRTPSSVSGGQNIIEEGAPAAPIVELLGVASTPTTLTRAAQKVRINGNPGQLVQLLVTEGGLFVSGIAGGGFDLHPYEDNRIGRLWETSVTIPAAGYIDVPITLTRADANSGFNHIVAVVKSADGRTGAVLNQMVVLFNPTDPPPPSVSVTSLTLINADTGQAIAGYQSIANGATIDLSKLPTTHLNVRANVSSGTASVLFGFDGNANYRIENMVPYALFADDAKGTYYAGTFAVGAHTITATPFTASKATGKAGTALKISFTVIKS